MGETMNTARPNYNIEDKNFNKTIHLTWLGSPLLDDHVERVLLWKKLNPEYTVCVWTNDEFKSAIEGQFKNQNIQIKNLAELIISADIANFIKKLIAAADNKSFPNYAAASDVYRFHILHELGGWYTDTDNFPTFLGTKSLNPVLKFHFNVSSCGYFEYCLNPSVIASFSKSVLTENALEFFEELAKPKYDKLVEHIRSNHATIRLITTENTTGSALHLAAQKILINKQPLVTRGSDQYIISNQSVYSVFKAANEHNWIFKNKEKSQLLDGIIRDKSFDMYVFDNQFTPEVVAVTDFIMEEILKIMATVKEKHVQLIRPVSPNLFQPRLQPVINPKVQIPDLVDVPLTP